ncbi:MAG: hypothetical protein HY430_00025 [Candidatus Levybacteria bacterium]|nr:hypothetical protein [Candidatus Levybacteria bacterium]
MAVATEITRHQFNPEARDVFLSLQQHRLGERQITVDGVVYPHLETLDFPQSDPWSRHMTAVVASSRSDGEFFGKHITELGVGDGRNIIHAGGEITGATVVDVEDWRLDSALINFSRHEATASLPIEAWHGDAVALLRDWETHKPGERIKGYVFACLPQSPDGDNLADRYDENSLLEPFAEWNRYGLTLNAAVLSHLRPLVEKDTRLLLMLSQRVPSDVRKKLFGKTGWDLVYEHKTTSPIQQDPDTGIGWVAQIEDEFAKDEHPFYAYEPEGNDFLPISASEAEERRLQSTGRDDLNVYHHLSVYELQPARPVIFEIFKSVSPNGNRNGDGLGYAA